jgi:opacity protein-like surface antigen
MNCKRVVGIFFISFFFLSYGYCLDGVEFFTGYLRGDLKELGDYECVPFLASFDFDIQSVFKRVGIDSDIDFVIEPFLNTVVNPKSNIEVGTNFLVKYTMPLTKKVKVYLKGGVGIIYMSLHTREQSTQYNFLPQIGVGFHYFLKENLALNFEYRYRHLSNASIKLPNKGIDADLFLTGFSIFY